MSYYEFLLIFGYVAFVRLKDMRLSRIIYWLFAGIMILIEFSTCMPVNSKYVYADKVRIVLTIHDVRIFIQIGSLM